MSWFQYGISGVGHTPLLWHGGGWSNFTSHVRKNVPIPLNWTVKHDSSLMVRVFLSLFLDCQFLLLWCRENKNYEIYLYGICDNHFKLLFVSRYCLHQSKWRDCRAASGYIMIWLNALMWEVHTEIICDKELRLLVITTYQDRWNSNYFGHMTLNIVKNTVTKCVFRRHLVMP